MSKAQHLASLLNASGNIEGSDIDNLTTGSMLQVKQAVYGSKYSYSGITTWGNTAITISLTAQQSGSHVKLDLSTHWSIQPSTSCLFRFVRDGSPFITVGNVFNGHFTDSGTSDTSAWGFNLSGSIIDTSGTLIAGQTYTYTLQIQPYDSSRTVYFNDTSAGGNEDDDGATILIATEVAQ